MIVVQRTPVISRDESRLAEIEMPATPTQPVPSPRSQMHRPHVVGRDLQTYIREPDFLYGCFTFETEILPREAEDRTEKVWVTMDHLP